MKRICLVFRPVLRDNYDNYPQITPSLFQEICEWYSDQTYSNLDYLYLPVHNLTLVYQNPYIIIHFDVRNDARDEDIDVVAEMISDPDDDGNYPLRDRYLVFPRSRNWHSMEN